MPKVSDGLKKTLMFFGRRSIVLIVGACFVAVWVLYYGGAITNPFFRKGNWVVVILYLTLYYIFTNLYGGFRIGSQKITDTVYANILSLLIVNVVTYFQIALISRGFLDPMPLVMGTLVQMAVIIVWAVAVTKLYFRIFKPVRLICVYDGAFPQEVTNKFSYVIDKFDIVDFQLISAVEESGCRSLMNCDGIIIVNVPDEKYAELLKFCVEKKLRYYLVPTIADILLHSSELIYINDMPLLLSKNEGLYLGQKLTKRLIDLGCSAAMILVLSPVMALCALAVKLSDHGPAIYRQKRCTKNGREFEILKFRSMRQNAESDGCARLASENDPRITRVGALLRKYRLDELPQLFNILRGDMSFVGPRPERPELIKAYKKELPEFDYRLGVKCGLTGYAQVIGRYNTTPEEKLKLDLIYIQNYSLLLDIKIMLMTVKAIFSKESSQGITDKDQSSEN